MVDKVHRSFSNGAKKRPNVNSTSDPTVRHSARLHTHRHRAMASRTGRALGGATPSHNCAVEPLVEFNLPYANTLCNNSPLSPAQRNVTTAFKLQRKRTQCTRQPHARRRKKGRDYAFQFRNDANSNGDASPFIAEPNSW